MERHDKSQWEAPVLASLEIRETAVKDSAAQDESGQRDCGPAAGGGAQDKCS